MLETGALGRAEVLLSPGVFLRMGHDSAFRLTSGKVWDARLELLSGTALVEAAEIGKGNRLTLAHGGATVTIEKSGLYRLDAEPAALRVLSGKAVVEASGKKYEVKGGRMLALAGEAAVARFDRKRGDSLDAWSERRSARLAQANMAATRSIAGDGICRGRAFGCGTPCSEPTPLFRPACTTPAPTVSIFGGITTSSRRWQHPLTAAGVARRPASRQVAPLAAQLDPPVRVLTPAVAAVLAATTAAAGARRRHPADLQPPIRSKVTPAWPPSPQDAHWGRGEVVFMSVVGCGSPPEGLAAGCRQPIVLPG
jgi:hypothetical protein